MAAVTSPTTIHGLTSEEAARRLAASGPNRLPVAARVSAWRRLAGEMTHFFARLFWVASGLALIAGLPQLTVAIVVVIVLNGLFAFAQEERAERAADRLRDLLPRRVTVVRDDVRIEIPAEGLVVGDLVQLAEGDRISADMVIDDARALAVDTSTLTGESVASHPARGDTLFAGSFVVEGDATALVHATGAETRLAAIATLAGNEDSPATPLRLELERLSRLIAIAATTIGVVFFVVGLLVGIPVRDGFLFAVGVAVALVPEGLLPTVTLSLARGAQQMAARNSLVRHLEAVETLGATTFICTDKTGTLTRNQMTVLEVWTPSGSACVDGVGYEPTGTVTCGATDRETIRALGCSAVRCSTGRVVRRDGEWCAQGDPMEAALHAFALRAGADPDRDAVLHPETTRFPFDPRRRRMSVIAGDVVFVKGAPDSVLPLCAPDPTAAQALRTLTARGLRVIAVATRRVSDTPADADAAERDLTLLGLIALEDPPRPEAAGAVAACRRAGIAIGMITGDHPATAAAIADQVGLRLGDAPVVTGAELPPDDDALARLVNHDGIVLARISPEDKLRIARALHRSGHVVAMTGDGVNDAPALREADIGVAMGKSGTDVAREAADLVLLDDNFATIVAAIEQGRATFSNIRRFLTYHLTDNVAELTPFVVWALSGGRFPLAIGVMQVLALDIGTDVLPALALGAESPAPHVLDRPPNRRHLLDRHLFLRSCAVLGLTEAVVTMFAFIGASFGRHWRPGMSFPTGAALAAASGAAFCAVVFGQAANAFACRSESRPIWRQGLRSNPLLLWAIGAELVMLAVFVGVTPVARALDQGRPSASGVALALLAVPAVIAVDTLHKLIRRNR